MFLCMYMSGCMLMSMLVGACAWCLGVVTWIPCGGKKKPTLTSCPLISIHVQWHELTYKHTRTYIHKINKHM